MKHRLAAIALVLSLLPTLAFAQQFPTIPDRSVIGRIGTGTSAGPSQAIPFATLQSSLIDVAAGLGTGVAQALAVNVGSPGAFVVNGGALGTPSSGVGTNITNVNAASLGGATFAAPGAIGGTTPAAGTFTALTAANTTFNPTTASGGFQVNGPAAATFVPKFTSPVGQSTVLQIGPSGTLAELQGDPSGNFLINTNGLVSGVFQLNRSGSVSNTLVLDSGRVTFGAAASFTANGSVATALGSIGPVGSHTTVQTWLTFKDNTGTVRFVPAF